MRLSRPFIFLALGSALALAAHAGPPEKTPDVFEADVESPSAAPLWVSAAAAIDQERVLNWDLLARDGALLRAAVEGQREHLKKTSALGPDAPELSVQRIAASDCYTTFSRTGGDSGFSRIEDLIRNSRAIFTGVVRSVDFGFASGAPSSLLTIEVGELLQGSGKLNKDRVYVDYPVARFAIGPYHFCNSQQGFEPKAGDRILVFVNFGPIGRDGLLLNPTIDRVFFESDTGGLQLPDRLRKDPVLAGKNRLAEIATLVREHLRWSPGR